MLSCEACTNCLTCFFCSRTEKYTWVRCRLIYPLFFAFLAVRKTELSLHSLIEFIAFCFCQQEVTSSWWWNWRKSPELSPFSLTKAISSFCNLVPVLCSPLYKVSHSNHRIPPNLNLLGMQWGNRPAGGEPNVSGFCLIATDIHLSVFPIISKFVHVELTPKIWWLS